MKDTRTTSEAVCKCGHLKGVHRKKVGKCLIETNQCGCTKFRPATPANYHGTCPDCGEERESAAPASITDSLGMNPVPAPALTVGAPACEQSISFYVEWSGEKAAGIRAGSEEVTIQFKYGQPLDSDTLEFWTQSLEEFYDGAKVTPTKINERTAALAAVPSNPALAELGELSEFAGFDEWWSVVGIHAMPRGDQPPEHAAIARLAWKDCISYVRSQLAALASEQNFHGVCSDCEVERSSAPGNEKGQK